MTTSTSVFRILISNIGLLLAFDQQFMIYFVNNPIKNIKFNTTLLSEHIL